MCPVGCSDFSVGFDPTYLVHPPTRTTHSGANSRGFHTEQVGFRGWPYEP